MLTVVTGWSPRGYQEYGQRFAETFARFVAPDVRLVVYGEEPVQLPRGEFRTLDCIPGCTAFINRHRAEPAANGRMVLPTWKPRAAALGYNWRFDAVKFCRQAFIPLDAAERLSEKDDPQYLAWFDGDVVWHRWTSAAMITGLLPEDFDVAYLGRGAKHSEIGFQLYRIRGTGGAYPLLERFEAVYRNDEVFTLKEWHSAFAWDHARIASRVRGWDLTPNGSGHVWHQSPLAAFSDHLKGERKAYGRSPERRR